MRNRWKLSAPGLALVLALVAALLGGCVSLRPFAQLLRELPAERFVEIDGPGGGQRVYVEQAGEGEPLLLLHGFGASSYSWRRVIPELAGSYRILAPDLNGFGFTERPQALASYTRDGQIDLILRLLDAFSIERAHVAGHSYGGSIALNLAFRHPERVASLILIDSAAPDYPQQRRNALAGIGPWPDLFVRGLALRRAFIARALRASVHDEAVVTPELVEAYRRRLQVEGAARAYRGLTAPIQKPGPEVDLAAIDLPTLVLWGAEDRLIPVGKGRQATERMPNSRFIALSGTGHIPMEERPGEVARHMLDFLRHHGAAPAP